MVSLKDGCDGVMLALRPIASNFLLDFDMANFADDKVKHSRRGEMFELLRGWKLYTLHEKANYEDATWRRSLDKDNSAEAEWKFAFIGTSLETLKSIIQRGLDTLEGPLAELYGKNILSVPDVEDAARMSQQFGHNGKHFKIVMLIKVNPNTLSKKPLTDPNIPQIWLSPKGDVRLCGILIKEANLIPHPFSFPLLKFPLLSEASSDAC